MTTYTQDVFGIQRNLPLNYVERDNVDTLFIESLSKKKHIIVYGSSKQGKTCLRKHCLRDSEYITVHCSGEMDLRQINTNILKQAGYEINVSEKKTVTGTNKIFASIKVGLGFGSAGAGSDISQSRTSEVNTMKLEIDAEDVNDIILALNEINFNKFIVLEDFHYLDTLIQQRFSVQLKAFHENSDLCFIIIGVWIEENRLTVFNGDLTGRLIAVNADHWPTASLLRVINKGEELLNIEFESSFKNELVSNCYENVYTVQEACYIACQESWILEKQNLKKTIKCKNAAIDLISNIIRQQSGRYNAFLTHFSSGFQSTDLDMYKWLLYPLLISSADQLKSGLKFSFIKQAIRSKHPRGTSLNTGNITQALQYTTNLQVKINIKPIILDYNQTDLRLDVVDRGFIIWLEYTDRDELLEMLSLPLSTAK